MKGFTKGADSELTSECTKIDNCISHSWITLKENSNDPPSDENKKDNASEAASTSLERRKVLKTLIDERAEKGLEHRAVIRAGAGTRSCDQGGGRSKEQEQQCGGGEAWSRNCR